MKQEFRTRLWLLLPMMILCAVIFAIISSDPAFAGSVKMNYSSFNLYTNGGKKSITLKLTDDGEVVKAKWKSSRKRVATVSSKGRVKAKRSGWTTIKATYDGHTYTCKIHVRKKSGTYKKAIKAYTTFLKNPYCLYKSNGARAQADEFCSVDLNKDGIPELLASVYSNGNYYFVLYHYSGGEMSTGQRLGKCSDFVWYSSRRILNYAKYESKRQLSVYGKHNGTALRFKAAMTGTSKGKHTYYINTQDETVLLDEKVSATKFRNYVDHDLLHYCNGKLLTMRINTPYNRSRYLK